MGRTRQPSSLSSLLSTVVDDMGISDRLGDTNVEEAWKKVAGPQAARVTRRVRMAGGRLTVYLTDATWRHALHAQREEWRDRVNESVGQPLVKEILFR